MINRTIAILCLIFALTFGGDVLSFDRYDIPVNDDNSGTDQYSPRLAVGRNGSFTIVWTDKRNGQSDIYSQLFDSTGTALGINRIINDDQSAAPQFEPTIDGSASGRFVSVWRDYRNGSYPFNPDIYFSQVDTLPTSANLNITGQTSGQTCESPDIAVFADGSAIVVWSDYRNNNWDIYGQRLGADGELVGENFRVDGDAGTAQQHSPRIAVLNNLDFVVVWYDNRHGDDDIFCQRFDSTVAPIGQDVRVSDDASSARQAFPSVAADGNGCFFVAWIDWRNGTYPNNPDIYLRRFDSSGAAMSPSMRVNGNDGGRPQRDVSLCSDRMGNIGIVWADSSSGQWDAVARIVDYQGHVDGSSFLIHDSTEGRQLQPDVDTDGYKFYFAWADNSSGNFDVYASIKEYNDPTLIPDPDMLEFTMEEGGVLPPSQTISLSNAGYGELNWSAVPVENWIAVSPSSGMTPDGFEVQIVCDTLSYGTYYGNIKLIDLDHHDSTEAVSVKLTVTAPELEISPDTLYFKVLAEVGNPVSRQFQINNGGSGYLTWTAAESAGWYEIDPASGMQSEFIAVQIDISGLEYGNYVEPLIISSEEAVNSPETAWVHLELVGNMPFLDARPDTVILSGIIGESLLSQVEVVNLGSGTLDWAAVPDDDWIALDRYTGSDYDTVNISIETSSMPSGNRASGILIYDSASFNLAISVPVTLNLASADTVQFLNSNTMPGGIGVIPVHVNLNLPASGGYIPFRFDQTASYLDSIVINESDMPSFVSYYTRIGIDGTGEIGFRVNDQMINDSTIPESDYHIADLFFTASDTDAFNIIDTLSSDSSGPYVLGQWLNEKVPVIIPGILIIGDPTSVNEDEDSPVPESAMLKQNYPNPFNSATTIEIYLPRPSVVICDIYNVLGQKVFRLQDGPLPAGSHRLIWNGTFRNSSDVPSGIYFYSVRTEGFSDVRKMLLIK